MPPGVLLPRSAHGDCTLCCRLARAAAPGVAVRAGVQEAARDDQEREGLDVTKCGQTSPLHVAPLYIPLLSPVSDAPGCSALLCAALSVIDVGVAAAVAAAVAAPAGGGNGEEEAGGGGPVLAVLKVVGGPMAEVLFSTVLVFWYWSTPVIVVPSHWLLPLGFWGTLMRGEKSVSIGVVLWVTVTGRVAKRLFNWAHPKANPVRAAPCFAALDIIALCTPAIALSSGAPTHYSCCL
eukprot:COSAG06_NODE_6451_length_2925_cov_7.829087_2_plen_236_part_00